MEEPQKDYLLTFYFTILLCVSINFLFFSGLLFGDVVLGGYQPHLGGWFEADKEDTSQQQIPDDGEESEEIQSKIHIAENSMSENRINTAALIEKRKLFFERPENSYENFFDLVKDSKKSGMCNL